MAQFTMPQLGETVAEGTITRWLKAEGDTVEADEALVEVSTDKVDSEIPSPMAGTLTKILVPEGETVAVGAAIAEITAGDGAVQAEEAAEPAEVPASVPQETAAPPEPEREAAPASVPQETAAPPEPEIQATQKAAPDGNGSASQQTGRRVLSPLVRKLASDKKIDLSTVAGTGPGGRVTRQDVLAASAPAGSVPEAPAAKAPAPQAAAGSDEIVPVTTMRKLIAEHMVSSHTETARAWNTIEVDMSAVGRLRKQAGAAFKKTEGFSLTWTPFVSRALCSALLEFPQLNATWNGDGTITRKHYVNLGIAVALDNGLIVPVIKGADQMNVLGLARATRDVAERARGKRLSPDEVTEGTFTLTNPGPFGSIMSVPIINKGQTAILALDAIVKRPVVVTDEHGEDSIAIRERVFLSMSWDHRIIDGAEAARFLQKLRSILEQGDFHSDLEAFLPG